MTNYQRTAKWLEACGKEQGNPEHFSTQAGVWMEEFLEVMQCVEIGLTPEEYNSFFGALDNLKAMSSALKEGRIHARVATGMRKEFLKEVCDLEVTGNGLCFMAIFDKDGADQAVMDSNDSKLVDGKAVFSEGSLKIAKGPNYKAPDLTPYI